MVCLDNSEWMRNGDYTPTRMEAQHDAANLVCGSKTQQNPESTVGILTMAGPGVQVLCSPTDDMGRILTASTGIKIGGRADFAAGLQIAQLALKHRKNKNGGQRIVVFVGSPIEAEEKRLVKIAKQLKKGNVAVDVVSMGEQETNEAKLEAFIAAVDKNSNSHLITIPSGVLPSDVLITSPVITGDDGSGGGGGMGAFSEFGGVDPNLDPELALALRVSMEEARAEAERSAAREQTSEGSGGSGAASSAPPPSSQAAVSSSGAGAGAGAGNDFDMDEDELLQQALMMSMMGDGGGAAGADASSRSDGDGKRSSTSSSASDGASFLDPGFVKGLLTGLPGVDVNDPKIRAAMSAVGAEADDDGEDDDKKKKKKKKKKDDDDSK